MRQLAIARSLVYDLLTDSWVCPAPVILLARVALLAAVALLFLAAPALAQPNRLEVVERIAAADAERFACAHSGRACEFAFIHALACALHSEDARWGLLGQRGNPNVAARDAVLWKGDGPGHDPTDGNRPVSAFDVIVSAGSPAARPGWGFINMAGPAAWIKPGNCSSGGGGGGGGGGGEKPPPAPTVNLQPILDAIAQLRAEVEQMHRTALATNLTITEVTARINDVTSRIDQMRERVEGLSGSSLVIKNMLENPPEYSGRVFGAGVTLRPVKR